MSINKACSRTAPNNVWVRAAIKLTDTIVHAMPREIHGWKMYGGRLAEILSYSALMEGYPPSICIEAFRQMLKPRINQV